jgi:hypothetical protein
MTNYGSSDNDNVRSSHTLGSLFFKAFMVLSVRHIAERPIAHLVWPRLGSRRVCDLQRVLQVNPSSSLSWRRSAWF